MDFPIELDSESVQLDGRWYTRPELAAKIKAMLDAGDFNVGRPSQALEQLTSALSSVKALTFKVTAEMAEALTEAASQKGKTIGALLRESIASSLGMVGSAGSEGKAMPPPLVRPGPGALKAAQPTPPPAEDAASAVELTKKKGEEEAVERRWFGG